ncbi:aminotransferase class V-fold PLP-dependent enzyme, partial [candidate division KSB3 bacterium]|nr:aminotransferase class V-fold PLP-dependent enzyme [candidate division KSB3 bacterium]MBD3325322.1 aminotransferase class V-fold PLP-dependent enzyme [candidate division KSB3 bacterium]
MPKHFASDNFAGAHPDILNAITAANAGHYPAYGADPFTASAIKKFHAHFGDDIEVFFVFGGTAANVLGLQALLDSYHAVICAESSHINVDECGAPEKFTGGKLLTLPSTNGKISVEQITRFLSDIGVEHHSQPRAISLTQATEMGTVYTPEEMADLADFAHQHNLAVHVDGARIANAAAFLHLDLRAITRDVGVDVLSFGGTKNGMMFGEAVIFFDRSYARNFKYIRKQGMQLLSKMRFIAAQFDAYLSNDLWRQNARHANAMAQVLARGLEKIPQVRITQPVEANAVFACIPANAVPQIQAQYLFYIWNAETSEA